MESYEYMCLLMYVEYHVLCKYEIVRYVLDKFIERVYAAHGPFKAILVQHKPAGHNEAFMRRTVFGPVRIAIMTCAYPTIRCLFIIK